MVSGLVTSPCDQLRIFSGEAMLILMASKSAMGLAMSKGLERYKVFLRVQNQWPVVSSQWPDQILAGCQVSIASCCFYFQSLRGGWAEAGLLTTAHWPLTTNRPRRWPPACARPP